MSFWHKRKIVYFMLKHHLVLEIFLKNFQFVRTFLKPKIFGKKLNNLWEFWKMLNFIRTTVSFLFKSFWKFRWSDLGSFAARITDFEQNRILTLLIGLVFKLWFWKLAKLVQIITVQSLTISFADNLQS